MIKKIAFTLTSLFLLLPAQVSATSTPEFPSCYQPHGQVIASYNEGTHGVPGDATTYTGSDVVYKINAEMVTQCLCSQQADGIQTNWWKVSSLSEEQIDLLKRDGWIYVGNGALWGLDQAPYLAKNSRYECRGRGSVLGATTGEVLGVSTLAGAGNKQEIALYFSLSIISLLMAVSLRRVANK